MAAATEVIMTPTLNRPSTSTLTTTSPDFRYRHLSDVTSALGGLWRRRLYTDVTLVAGGSHVRCHRVVLASASPYFHSRLYNGKKENSSDKIFINDVPSSILCEVLDFVYSGECGLKESNAEDLLRAATIFQLAALKDMCDSFLQDFVRVKNALRLYKMARATRSPRMEERAREVIFTHLAQLWRTKLFKQLTHHELISLLRPCYDHHHHHYHDIRPRQKDKNDEEDKEDNEDKKEEENKGGKDEGEEVDEVCRAVLTWVNTDSVRRKHVLGEIMRSIRLSMVRQEAVRQLLEEDGVKDEEVSLQMIQDTVRQIQTQDTTNYSVTLTSPTPGQEPTTHPGQIDRDPVSNRGQVTEDPVTIPGQVDEVMKPGQYNQATKPGQVDRLMTPGQLSQPRVTTPGQFSQAPAPKAGQVIRQETSSLRPQQRSEVGLQEVTSPPVQGPGGITAVTPTPKLRQERPEEVDVLVMVGGVETQGGTARPRQEVHAFHLSLRKWFSLPPVPQHCDSGAACCARGGDVFLCGAGDTRRGLLKLDREQNAWRVLAPMGIGRRGHVVAVSGPFLYVAGGVLEEEEDTTPGSGKSRTTAVVERYDVRKDRWKEMGQLAEPVWGASAVVFKEKLHVFGGFHGSKDKPTSMVQTFHPASRSCRVTSQLPFPMALSRALVNDGVVTVLGPSGHVLISADCWRFRMAASIPGFKRALFGLAEHQGLLYVAGGRCGRQAHDRVLVVDAKHGTMVRLPQRLPRAVWGCGFLHVAMDPARLGEAEEVEEDEEAKEEEG